MLLKRKMYYSSVNTACVLAGAQPGYNTGVQFPKRFVNFTAFVAEHGSLTKPQRPGFRVAAVRVTNGNGTSTSHVNFASGWLINGVPWGAPLLFTFLDGLVFQPWCNSSGRMIL